jgi:hypothetical protein
MTDKEGVVAAQPILKPRPIDEKDAAAVMERIVGSG